MVPIISPSSVSGTAGLKIIKLVGWHVLRDWFFPINNSSVSVFIFVEANVLCISVAQDVYLSFISNNLRKWVCMSHPRHFLCLASFPSPTSFLRKSASSRLRGSVGCSDHNSVQMINISVIFTRYIQCLSLTVMVMVSLVNPPIDTSVAAMSTAKGSIFAKMFCLLLFILLWD